MSARARLTIVGLGPGAPEHLTAAAAAALSEARVLVRTRLHPVAQSFPNADRWMSCDDLYEAASSFEEVYDRIVGRVIEEARRAPLVYAVPGHPLVGEATVRRLLVDAPQHGIEYSIVPGLSFVDAVLPILGIDALATNLQIVDALELVSCLEAAPFAAGRSPLSPLRPALLGQLYDRPLASQVKLALERLYPPTVTVSIVRQAGTSSPLVLHVPLHELDHYHYDASTAVYLPPVDPLDARVTEALQQVVARLRAPGGCPWDREQTHQSLRRHLLEETYEVLEVIDREDDEALCEELGDVLLQVIMHAQLAEERGTFVYEDIVAAVIEKLVRRHPHVFGETKAESVGVVLTRWEQIKAAEREEEEPPRHVVPLTLPALARAQELVERLRRLYPERYEALRQHVAGTTPETTADTILQQLVSSVLAASEQALDAEAALRMWTLELERTHFGEASAYQSDG
uniref:MazG family protein n=1 Tax=Thermomicrobium roseum TaxID=500 RepID=A0A7C5RST2_THERO